MIIVFLGPQGSGKGTQAVLLEKKFDLPIIEMGQLFRRVAQENSTRGLKIKNKLMRGELISDKIAIDVLKTELEKMNLKKRFILDGFPRSLTQARFLEKFDKKVIIYLEITDSEVIKRLSRRRVCSSCNAVFTNQKRFTKCSICGGKLKRREDDKPEIIQKRLSLFKKLTEPVLDFYRSKNILLEINGQQKINKVFADILKALKKN